MKGRFQLSVLDNGPWLWVREGAASWLDSIGVHRRASQYDDSQLAACCLFIGYPRSGHSVVGSVLDAHPDALVAHRLDAVGYIERGYSPTMLAHMIVCNSRRFALNGRGLTGYSYHIPDSWQGRYRTLRVIGDQEGRLTAVRLAAHPASLDAFEQRFGVPVKLLHVIRNPYDNITTWAIKRFAKLETTIAAYFALCHAVATVIEHRQGQGIMHIRHEEFLARPQAIIPAICHFVGLEPQPDFVSSCVASLYQSPRISRHQRSWPPHLIARVAEEAAAFPFLQGYGWDDQALSMGTTDAEDTAQP